MQETFPLRALGKFEQKKTQNKAFDKILTQSFEVMAKSRIEVTAFLEGLR